MSDCNYSEKKLLEQKRSIDPSDLRKMIKEIGIEETRKKLVFSTREDFRRFCKLRGVILERKRGADNGSIWR